MSTKPNNRLSASKQFERIAEETIERAENVDCSLRDFAAGLKDSEIAVKERRVMAEDEADWSESE